MADTFTDLMLRKITSGDLDRVEVWDDRIPGFGLRVSKTGTKTFVLLYRHRGRPRRLTLGRYPTLTLAHARNKAIDALREVDAGRDPVLEQESINDVSYRFETIVDQFIAKHCKVHNKPGTANETERLLRTHFAAAWAKRDIRDITQNHISSIIDTLVADEAPSEANHALVALKTMLRWSVDRKFLTLNPAATIRKPFKATARSRVLSDDELGRVLRVFIAEGYPFGTMGHLLVLTAQRRGEVTNMRWSQIDWDAKTWTIPADLAKNSREHMLPLSAAALAILKAIPRLSDDRVFPSRYHDTNAISGFSRAKGRFDKLSSVTDWTIHDLRRTVTTGLARMRVPPHVCEKILNHVSGTFAGVAGVYNRFEYQDEMREALDRWDARVAALADAERQPSDLPAALPLSAEAMGRAQRRPHPRD